MSLPAKVAVVVVAVGAAVLTTVILVLDFVSEHPSSTAPLIFPFMALYVSIVVAFVALLDWGIRRFFGR